MGCNKAAARRTRIVARCLGALRGSCEQLWTSKTRQISSSDCVSESQGRPMHRLEAYGCLVCLSWRCLTRSCRTRAHYVGPLGGLRWGDHQRWGRCFHRTDTRSQGLSLKRVGLSLLCTGVGPRSCICADRR